MNIDSLQGRPRVDAFRGCYCFGGTSNILLPVEAQQHASCHSTQWHLRVPSAWLLCSCYRQFPDRQVATFQEKPHGQAAKVRCNSFIVYIIWVHTWHVRHCSTTEDCSTSLSQPTQHYSRPILNTAHTNCITVTVTQHYAGISPCGHALSRPFVQLYRLWCLQLTHLESLFCCSRCRV